MSPVYVPADALQLRLRKADNLKGIVKTLQNALSVLAAAADLKSETKNSQDLFRLGWVDVWVEGTNAAVAFTSHREYTHTRVNGRLVAQMIPVAPTLRNVKAAEALLTNLLEYSKWCAAVEAGKATEWPVMVDTGGLLDALFGGKWYTMYLESEQRIVEDLLAIAERIPVQA